MCVFYQGLAEHVSGKTFVSPLLIDFDDKKKTVHLNGSDFNKKQDNNNSEVKI